MANLTTLARQISQCPTRGDKRHYSDELKNKICAAANKHGQNHVAEKIGVNRSLIYAWVNKSSEKNDKMLTTPAVDALVLQELPHSTFRPLEKEQRPIIRLVSPTGVSMEINATSEVNLPELINIFMRGPQ